MENFNNEINRRIKIATIVIGISHYNTLGVIRSLGESDLPIYLIIKGDKKSYVEYSKYIKKSYRIRNLQEIDYIVGKLSKLYDKCVLFPVSDEMAIYCDRLHKNMQKEIVAPGMSCNIENYMGKLYSKEKAYEAGILVPKGKQIFLFKEKVEWNKYPCIVKPIISILGRKCDISKVENEEQLGKVLRKYKEIGYKEVLIEEFIYGKEEYMIELMGERSNKGISFGPIIKKIREYPLVNGSTAYAKFIKKQEGLDFISIEKYLDESQYMGLFDLEFKYSDGKLYFIECNFRNGAPNNAITLNGTNLPLRWIENMLDETISTKVVYKNYEYFMVEQMDVLNALKGDVRKGEWIKQFLCSKKILLKYQDFLPFVFFNYEFLKKIFYKLRGFVKWEE